MFLRKEFLAELILIECEILSPLISDSMVKLGRYIEEFYYLLATTILSY
jgi:hypothetical protein